MFEITRFKKYIKKGLLFLPIFTLLYINGSNLYGYSETLYTNLFGNISGEKLLMV